MQERQQQAMELVMDAGRTLLENGAEVFRVQQTMQIMASSLGLEEFDVYVITNGIFASVRGEVSGQIRHVPSQTIHLGRVAAVNDLSRRIAAGQVDAAQAHQELQRIKAIPYASRATHLMACSMGSACFALLFGGVLADGAAGFVVGFVLQCFLLLANEQRLNKIFTKLMGAVLVAVMALLIVGLLPMLHMDKIIIGALMPLTPGVALTTSIRDFVNGDYLSGTIRMIDALLIAGALACGVGLVFSLVQGGLGVAL